MSCSIDWRWTVTRHVPDRICERGICFTSFLTATRRRSCLGYRPVCWCRLRTAHFFLLRWNAFRHRLEGHPVVCAGRVNFEAFRLWQSKPSRSKTVARAQIGPLLFCGKMFQKTFLNSVAVTFFPAKSLLVISTVSFLVVSVVAKRLLSLRLKNRKTFVTATISLLRNSTVQSRCFLKPALHGF